MSTYLREVASRLIALDTVSSTSNAQAMEYLGDHLEGRGFRVSFQRVEVAGVSKVNLVACAGPAEPDGLIISGHTDHKEVPGGRESLALGERRAQAVKDYFVSKGIATDRIAIMSYGWYRPDETTTDASPKNRRTVTIDRLLQ